MICPHVPMTNSRPETVLIITSSGGGGLIQTANAKEQEIRAQNPSARILRYDVLKDWIWLGMGKGSIFFYNQAQRLGNMFMLRACLAWQPIIDPLFWSSIFVHSLRVFCQENVDRIIDTQPMGTSALLKALRIFNRRMNKQVLLEKIVVDLPTPAATHFFRPVKQLSEKDKKYLKLVTISPMLESGQTEEQFWKEHCNISPAQVEIQVPFVRQAFHRYQKRVGPKEPISILTRCKSAEEQQLVQESYQRGPIRGVIQELTTRFEIPSDAYVITLLLGSQPANNATQRYVELFRKMAARRSGQPVVLFVFCSDHPPGKPSLLRSVAAKKEGHPANLSIIPLSFQSEETIASLFFRSDLTCTRSGGQTAMELMRVNSGETWIHSEAKDPKSKKELLRGIIGWEAGNALYLERAIGSKIVTPEEQNYEHLLP